MKASDRLIVIAFICVSAVILAAAVRRGNLPASRVLVLAGSFVITLTVLESLSVIGLDVFNAAIFIGIATELTAFLY